MKNKIFIFSLLVLLLVFKYARAASISPVFISQVQISGGPDKTDDDFIELFNPNTSSVNLKGFRLVKRTAAANSDVLIKSWTKDTILPPKRFYLWANSGYTTITAKPDVATSAALSGDSGVAYGQNQPAAGKTRGINYLILSAAAFLALVFVVWKFVYQSKGQ